MFQAPAPSIPAVVVAGFTIRHPIHQQWGDAAIEVAPDKAL
jgi:hypothetical protein